MKLELIFKSGTGVQDWYNVVAAWLNLLASLPGVLFGAAFLPGQICKLPPSKCLGEAVYC